MNIFAKNNRSRIRRVFAGVLLLLPVLAIMINSSLMHAATTTASNTVKSVSGAEPAVNSGTDDENGLTSAYRKGMVSAGLYHTVLLNEDGRVYCWGDNSFGQLGTGSVESEDSPVLVPDLVNIVMVSAGAYHTLALSADGNLYAWGRNTYGQIGNGTSTPALSPVLIENIPPIREISAGSYHSLALTLDGSVYAWGNNTDLQVGDVLSEIITDEGGNTLGKRVESPQQIIESGAVSVAAGGSHSLYLDGKGQVFAWGNNEKGQLGDGTQISRGNPVQVYGLSSVKAISAGFSHNLAMTEQTVEVNKTKETYQNLYVWGSDSTGQLGLRENFDENNYIDRATRLDLTNDNNEKNDRISLIMAGYSNSMITVPVIKKEKRFDSIYVWGNNAYGQLGIGNLPSQNAPVKLAATSNGWTGSLFLPFQSIAIGGYHTVFLSVKGFVGTVGRANKGQLGNVSVIDCNVPIGVTVPDAISPEWMGSAVLNASTPDLSGLLLNWPAAKDNIKVTGYELTYLNKSGESQTVSVPASKTQYKLNDYNPAKAQTVLLTALDAAGNRSSAPLEYSYIPPAPAAASVASGADASSNAGASVSGEASKTAGASPAASGTTGGSSAAASGTKSVSRQTSAITKTAAAVKTTAATTKNVAVVKTATTTKAAASTKASAAASPATSASPALSPALSQTSGSAASEPAGSTSGKTDELAWSPALYGEIIPLEVPWNVDYVYGKGVVLPPKDYTWIVAVAVSVAVVLFFVFLAMVSFKRNHQGHTLFKDIFETIGRKLKRRKNRKQNIKDRKGNKDKEVNQDPAEVNQDPAEDNQELAEVNQEPAEDNQDPTEDNQDPTEDNPSGNPSPENSRTPNDKTGKADDKSEKCDG